MPIYRKVVEYSIIHSQNEYYAGIEKELRSMWPHMEWFPGNIKVYTFNYLLEWKETQEV